MLPSRSLFIDRLHLGVEVAQGLSLAALGSDLAHQLRARSEEATSRVAGLVRAVRLVTTANLMSVWGAECTGGMVCADVVCDDRGMAMSAAVCLQGPVALEVGWTVLQRQVTSSGAKLVITHGDIVIGGTAGDAGG